MEDFIQEIYYPYFLGVLLTLGAVFSLILTPRVIKYAKKIGVVDAPNSRKVHQKITPRMGGLAIFISFSSVFLIALPLALPFTAESDSRPFWSIIVGGFLIFAVGLYDDVKDLRARYKFLAQIVIAIFVASQGVLVEELTLPFLSAPVEIHPLLGWVITILWIVGVCNAINLMDGLDGLAAGISLIVMVTISAVALMNQNYSVAFISFPLMGSVIGFLKYNFHPAKTFMGDCGSLYLGYMLASLSLLNSSLETSTVSLLMPIVALGLPIFDTVFSMVRRLLIGRKIFSPDKEHVHHQILNKGFSHKQTVIILYLIASAFCILAFSIIALQNKGLAALILLYPLMFYWLIRRLGYLKKIAHFRIRWVRHLSRGVYMRDYKTYSLASKIFRYFTSNHIFLRFLDFIGWNVCWFLALVFANPNLINDPQVFLTLWKAHAYYIFFFGAAFQLWMCYIDIWRFLEFNGIGRYYKSTTISILTFYLLVPFLAPSVHFSWNFYGLLWFFNIGYVTFSRVIHNYYFNFIKREASHLKDGEKVLIYGAGDNGKLMQTLFTRMDNLQYNLVGFIDDDPLKHGKCIYRYPVLGTTQDINKIIRKYEISDLVFSTIPTGRNMELLEELDREHKIKLTVFGVELHEVHSLEDLRSTIQQKLGA